MKKSINPELASTINRQAYMLAALSFPAIRATLEDKARTMPKDGRSLDETLREIRAAGINDAPPTP